MKWLLAFITLFSVTSLVVVPAAAADQRPRVDPELYMDPTELITSKGYPCENHYVTTQDGFILNMQWIPHGRQPAAIPPGGQPVVILQHGLIGSSSNWLANLANGSLAYLLADRGADVWLGNVRGNTYSRNHTTLRPNQDKFWDWSLDEMAALDLPAMVDHVLRVSGAEHVHYVGHSQGTMMGFAGFSSNATLASLVKRFYALAPVAMVANIESPVKLLAPYATDIGKFFELFGHGAYDEYNRRLRDFLARTVCGELGHVLCQDDLFVIGGVDKISLNTGVEYKKFQKFDYGSAAANQAKYGQPTPPQYAPEKVHVPVVAYSSGHDILADPTDVAWLLQRLTPSLLASHYIPHWDHLDFIWAFDSPVYCYNDIISWVLHD